MAVGYAPERGARTQLLVLHHRRPIGDRMRSRIGIENIMLESDYPHADSTWPDTQVVIGVHARASAGRGVCARFVGGNAARAFPASVARLMTTGGCRREESTHQSAHHCRRRRTRREPQEAWAEIPEHQRPLITRDASGYEHVVVAGKEILAVPLGTLATPGSVFSDSSAFRPLAEAQPGGYDPVLRLADMDSEGIDQAVLFPSVGLYAWAITDPDAAVSVAKAYNDWLSSYCAADSARLFGAAMIPAQDPDAAVSELKRAANTLGFTAAFVRPNPCMGRSLPDPAYEPIWNAAEELGVAIGIHEGSSVIIPTLGSDRPFNPLVLHTISHSFEEMLAFAEMAAFGVFERHPALKFVFLESGGGWAPFWVERLDEQAETFGGFCPDMRLKPSEYFERQCWISYEVDEPTLPALLPFIGEDRVVWGSDYPHHDATFPGAVGRDRANDRAARSSKARKGARCQCGHALRNCLLVSKGLLRWRKSTSGLSRATTAKHSASCSRRRGLKDEWTHPHRSRGDKPLLRRRTLYTPGLRTSPVGCRGRG